MDEGSGMRPTMGMSDMMLPITFDYSGGRGEKKKSEGIWAFFTLVVGFLIALAIASSSNSILLMKFIVFLAVMYVTLFIVRFAILKEGTYRDDMLKLDELNGVIKEKDIWGIYSIGNQYPYICRFRNTKNGIFVRLEKDVVLGKYNESEFEHFEAIADALNIAGSSKIQLCHIDFMTDMGMDTRLDDSYSNLNRIDNPDIRSLLSQVYTYQKDLMLERVTTYDTYLFMWKGSDIAAWNTIQGILSCFLEANYRSFQVLDSMELRLLCRDLFNLKEFSAMNAMLNAFDNSTGAKITPVKIIQPDGTEEKLGFTREEQIIRREIKEKQLEDEKRDRKIKRKEAQRSRDTVVEDEDLSDLFS